MKYSLLFLILCLVITPFFIFKFVCQLRTELDNAAWSCWFSSVGITQYIKSKTTPQLPIGIGAEETLKQGRPTFFSRGPRAKFAVPKVLRAKI